MMAKIAVVFWSGSGNTEAMANAVVEGVKKGGAEAELIRVGDFSADRIADYDGVLMGCPACGTEELDETEFEPFFAEAESQLKDVKVLRLGRRYVHGDVDGAHAGSGREHGRGRRNLRERAGRRCDRALRGARRSDGKGGRVNSFR